MQTAAGSTVGRLVLQLARAEGFRTINLVRRRAQVAEIETLGGDKVICTGDENWQARLTAATGGQGVTKAIDCVAGRTGATVARSLAPGGRMLVYGALSSHRQTDPSAFELPLFAPGLIYNATTVQGWFLFHWLTSNPLSGGVSGLRHVLDHPASGVLSLPPSARYPLSKVQAAMRDAESTEREGKPLLDFSEA